MSLLDLTNNQLAEGTRAHLQEIESRLTMADKPRALKRVRAAHAILQSVGLDLADDGDVSTESIGDKDF